MLFEQFGEPERSFIVYHNLLAEPALHDFLGVSEAQRIERSGPDNLVIHKNEFLVHLCLMHDTDSPTREGALQPAVRRHLVRVAVVGGLRYHVNLDSPIQCCPDHCLKLRKTRTGKERGVKYYPPLRGLYVVSQELIKLCLSDKLNP